MSCSFFFPLWRPKRGKGGNLYHKYLVFYFIFFSFASCRRFFFAMHLFPSRSNIPPHRELFNPSTCAPFLPPPLNTTEEGKEKKKKKKKRSNRARALFPLRVCARARPNELAQIYFLNSPLPLRIIFCLLISAPTMADHRPAVPLGSCRDNPPPAQFPLPTPAGAWETPLEKTWGGQCGSW